MRNDTITDAVGAGTLLMLGFVGLAWAFGGGAEPAEAGASPREFAQGQAAYEVEQCYVAEGTPEAAGACGKAARTVRRTKCWAEMNARATGGRSAIPCSLEYLDDIEPPAL